MNKAFAHLRLAAIAGLLSLTGGATLAVGQASAEQTSNAIRLVDPTPGEMPELPTTAETTPQDAPVMVSQPVVQNVPEPAPEPASTRAANDPFVIQSILPVEGTIRYGDWFWDESRAPASGPLVVTVDLEARVVSVFRGGHEIGTAVALLGTTSHPTPLGTFPILTKEKDNISEKYNDAPMPWTLRLTWDGIAIHGSPVMNGYASHGCIGVPDPFAEKLFALAKRGDKVVITRGQFVGVGDRILS
jgi:lipoprotein-anchoring transpeptidase ErfK/SrfK